MKNLPHKSWLPLSCLLLAASMAPSAQAGNVNFDCGKGFPILLPKSDPPNDKRRPSITLQTVPSIIETTLTRGGLTSRAAANFGETQVEIGGVSRRRNSRCYAADR